MGCAFCATDAWGFAATWPPGRSSTRCSDPGRLAASGGGVVFMGMGEPLLNYDK